VNKQEALEAVLVKCRTYEQPTGEVVRVPPVAVLRELGALCERVSRSAATNGRTPAASVLAEVAGAALYLLAYDPLFVSVPPSRPSPSQDGPGVHRA
jgi:hypothetical protein